MIGAKRGIIVATRWCRGGNVAVHRETGKSMTSFNSVRKSAIVKRLSHAMVLGSALVLAGCETLELTGGKFMGQRQTPLLEKAASGSRFETFLVWSDRREIDMAAWTAAEALTPRAEVSWENLATGSFGSVRSGVVYLVGFNAGAEVEAPVGLDTSFMLDPAAGNYVTNANANVRLAPRMDAQKATLLRRGNRVKVIAREAADGWFLVASGNRVVGYVYGDLIDKVGDGDLLLAGGDAQFPRLCRELTYKMTFSTGKSNEWLNGACREGKQKWAVIGGRPLEAAE